MLTTRFTELVGCSVPIQLAGMATFSNPRLAAAVATAGGQGMVSVYDDAPARVAARLDDARARTSGVLGANFILRFVDPAHRDESIAAAAERVRVVDLFYSEPDAAVIELVHRHGALVCWNMGSVEEARAAADAGADLIVAQGIEAGGHVRGRIGMLALLDAVLEAVEAPVLAAGGIGTGRAMAAVLAAGADGVRVGTRFVAAEEAEAHPEYVANLIAARAEDTRLTEAFSRGWPDAPHRVLGACIEAAEAFGGDIVGERPRPGTEPAVPMRRFEPFTINRETSGTIAAMPQWAGESVNGVTRMQSAAEIVRELTEAAEHWLRRPW